MKTFLIDGYNLAHKVPAIAQLLHARDFYTAIERLVQFIQQKINTRAHRVIIVFDGRKGVFERPTVSATVEIQFARKPQEADDVIRQYLRQASDTSEITVISSDREILKSARDLGAQFVTSEQFARNKPNQTNSPPSEKPDAENIDVAYWLEQFNKRNDEDF